MLRQLVIHPPEHHLIPLRFIAEIRKFVLPPLQMSQVQDQGQPNDMSLLQNT